MYPLGLSNKWIIKKAICGRWRPPTADIPSYRKEKQLPERHFVYILATDVSSTLLYRFTVFLMECNERTATLDNTNQPTNPPKRYCQHQSEIMTNPRDSSKAVGANSGRRSRRRRSQTSMNLRDAFRSDQSTSGSASPTSTRTTTSSASSSLHGGADASQGAVQVDGDDGRLSRRDMLEILEAAIDMANEALSDSGADRPPSETSENNEDGKRSPMQ